MKSIESAIEIIGNRRQDSRLVKKASNLLGNDIPDTIKAVNMPICIAPHVAGGTIAELEFAKEVIASGAQPIWTSYIEDRFTTRNPVKVNHWRPRIAWPKGQLTRQWIVPETVRKDPGIGIGAAPTVFESGVRIISVAEYQGSLAKLALEAASSTIEPLTIDYSEWYSRQSALRGMSRSAKGYYSAIMALYSVFGVLFRYDNQPGNQDLLSFRQSVAIPAAEFVKDKLGVEPVIVSRDYPENGMVTDLSQLERAGAIAAAVLPCGRVGGENACN